MRTLLCLLLAVATPAVAADGDATTATAPATDADARAQAKKLMTAVQAARAEVKRALAMETPKDASNVEVGQWNEVGTWLGTVDTRLGELEATLGKSALLTEAPVEKGAMVSEMAKMNMEFLALQSAMQNESRKFQTMSNASRSRHDVAMNAVRNIEA